MSLDFRERFDASDIFQTGGKISYADPVRGLAMRRTNIIPDILSCELPPDNRRAFDYRRIEPPWRAPTFT